MTTTQSTASTPASPGDRLLLVNWRDAVARDAAGVPRLPVSFVAEQGQRVRIFDVRELDDLRGPLGHIPAVTHVPLSNLAEVPVVIGHDTPVVIVSNRGERAAVAARYLESLGMTTVAALDGGMVAWKAAGFVTRRDDTFRTKLRALLPGESRTGGALAGSLETPGGLRADDVAAHVGDPGSLRWIKLAAFLLHGKRSCVDGRDDHGVIGTPGGDAGEILLALSAVERLKQRPLTDDEVRDVLIAHVDTFGPFYMHTDMAAMNRLIVDKLRKDPRIEPAIRDLDAADDWRDFMANPPVAVRDALLSHLVSPDVMGCGHLRFAMTDEASYGVRAGLALSLLRAFHTVRWSGAPELEWVVLGGAHAEGGVMQVILDEELRTFSRVPLVSPSVRGTQVFVNHPQVTTFMREELVRFLCQTGAAGLTPDDDDALCELVTAWGDKQLQATLARLAKGLPVFEVHFKDGLPVVREAGRVAG